jgi:hypothetical protein
MYSNFLRMLDTASRIIMWCYILEYRNWAVWLLLWCSSFKMTVFLMRQNCYTSAYLFFQCCLQESIRNFLFCIIISLTCSAPYWSTVFQVFYFLSLVCNISDRKPCFQLHETTSFLNQLCFCEGIEHILSTLHICISFAMYCDLMETEHLCKKFVRLCFHRCSIIIMSCT